VLVPRVDMARTIEITLPGGFNVTPRLAQALKILPGVERVEEI
jgi:DNA polymerase-3 subunit alpha